MRWTFLAVGLVAATASAMGPLEKNHPLVEEGTQLFEAGEFEKALEKYDGAALERPRDARVQYNRGLCLHKLGRQDEAKAALTRAAELDTDQALAARIHYNLGNVDVARGNKREAISEYRKALMKDPSDELARHNLEIVLKDVPPKSPPGPDGGPGDGGARTDAGQLDAGLDGGRPDAGRPDGGGGDGGSDGGQMTPGDGGQADGGQGDGGAGQQKRPGDGGQKSDESERSDGGGTDAGSEQADEAQAREARLADGGVDLSKRDAERLLDSLKGSEKNMQLWRFRQKTPKSDPHGKDW